MVNELKAEDLLPIITRLSESERRRLIQLALRQAGSDATSYRSKPTNAEEFGADDDSLSWEADGWEDIG